MFAQSDAEVKFKVVLDDNEAGKSVDNLSKKTDNLSKKLTSFGKTMSVGVTLPLTALATAGIKYNASMETYMANLTTLLNGNQEAASQLLSDLKAMANTTPFETTSLVKATQTMLGFGIQVQDSQKYLKQLGDISMGDAQKLESLTLAFSQVSSAGKLSGQDFEILFLDAQDDVLVKRYKETRRTHPLAEGQRLDCGIQKEREQLQALRRKADYILDTSQMLTRELQSELHRIFVENKEYKNIYVNINFLMHHILVRI
mgnify:CR=1 FL=1